EPLVGFQPAVDRPVRLALLFQVAQPFGLVQFLDPAGNRVEEALVDAEVLRFVLVAEEEVGVLPAVTLRRRRLGAVEAELLGAFADRVVAVEQLHVAWPRVFLGERRDRRKEGLAATRALQVVEDLDRDRRVRGAESVAFLRHAAEGFLCFADAGDPDHVWAGFLDRDLDKRVAERDQGEGEGEDHPDTAAARDRHDRGLGVGAWGGRGHWRHYRASPSSADGPKLRKKAVDTSARGSKFSLPGFNDKGRSAVANHL